MVGDCEKAGVGRSVWRQVCGGSVRRQVCVCGGGGRGGLGRSQGGGGGGGGRGEPRLGTIRSCGFEAAGAPSLPHFRLLFTSPRS